ncbi:MAG: hypothetical protein LUQ31_03170 [Methanoregula sp.]|nr:hypothetical protein [Methanoregula sp.]
MGSAQDVMQTFAQKEIRAHFRDFDGWECRQVPSPRARDMACILTREVRGRKEIVALAVSYDEEPSLIAVDTVAAPLKGNRAFKGKYLIVPKDANVSAVPGDIRILYMEAFGFVEGTLLWLTKKKNVKHYSQPEEQAAARGAPAACEPHVA